MLEFSTETKLTPSRSTGIYTFDGNLYIICDAHKRHQSAHHTPLYFYVDLFLVKSVINIHTHTPPIRWFQPETRKLCFCAAQKIVFSRIFRIKNYMCYFGVDATYKLLNALQ